MRVVSFKETQLVSPTLMYSLATNVDGGLGCTENDFTQYCAVRYNFIWPHGETCNYNFICEDLSGKNYDADHGLILIGHDSTKLVKLANRYVGISVKTMQKGPENNRLLRGCKANIKAFYLAKKSQDIAK